MSLSSSELVLIGVMIGSAGLAHARDASVPSYRVFPEADIGTALVVLPADAGDAVFFRKAN
ncbi:MAG: hypothetical protein RR059_07350 [Clostridia bacterium]